MIEIASQITSLTVVYSIVNSCADQSKHQSSASLAFVRGKFTGTGEFPAQKASNAENVSTWWRHHEVIHVKHYFIHILSGSNASTSLFPWNISKTSNSWIRNCRCVCWWPLTLNMLNYFKDHKRYSHNFYSYLGFGLAQVDESNCGTTTHVFCHSQCHAC